MFSRSVVSSSDDVFNYWEFNRALVSKTDFSKNDPIFPQYNGCSCQITGKSFLSRSCQDCYSLGLLYHRGLIIPNRVVQIYQGRYTNENIQTVVSDSFSNLYHQLLNQQLISFLGSFKSYNNPTKYFSTNNCELNYAVISCIMEHEFKKVKIPCIPIFKYMFSCGHKNITIDQIPSLGIGTLDILIKISGYLDSPSTPISRKVNLTPLKTEIGRGILFQLITTLKQLSSYDFSHGTPTLGYLGFSNNPVNYNYQNKIITCPVTLHLIPSVNSSITVFNSEKRENHRIFCNNSQIFPSFYVKPTRKSYLGNSDTNKFNMPDLPFHPDYISRSIEGYEITSDDLNIIRNHGVSLFGSSLDLYFFWMSLMTQDCFVQYMERDIQMMEIWSSLFPPNYSYQVPSNGTDLWDLLNSLKNVTLRYDALDHCWLQMINMM